MSKVSIILLISLFLFACNKEKANRNSFNEVKIFKDAINEDVTGNNFTSESYRKEISLIIKEGKGRLRKILPTIIDKQVKLYAKTIPELKAIDVMSIDKKKSISRTRELNIDIAVNLYNDELFINEVYYDILYQLSQVNDRYYNHYLLDENHEIALKGFDQGRNFVLAEEVARKIDELVKDDRVRQEKETQQLQIGVGLSIIQMIPAASAVTKLTEAVVEGARVAKGWKNVNANSKLSKWTAKILSKKTAARIQNALSNSVKRNRVSKRIAFVGGAGVAADVGYNLNVYRNIENKIEGRIGDFSDGMIAVHVQMLIDIAKENCKTLKKVKGDKY